MHQNGVLYRNLKADELEIMLQDLQRITDDASNPKGADEEKNKNQKDSKEVRP